MPPSYFQAHLPRFHHSPCCGLLPQGLSPRNLQMGSRHQSLHSPTSSGATFQSGPRIVGWQTLSMGPQDPSSANSFVDAPISIINSLGIVPSRGFGVRQEGYLQGLRTLLPYPERQSRRRGEMGEQSRDERASWVVWVGPGENLASTVSSCLWNVVS